MSNIDTSSWKEFKLDEILQKVNTVKIPLKKSDCPIIPTDTYIIPARTATASNQGLSCYVPADLCTVLKNKISVSANGDFCAFWHDSNFTILQDAYALEGKGFELTEKIALFLISIMTHSFSQKYNWNNKSGWEKLRNETIKLPVKESEEINWEYMQERISELEQERISELEQYLVAAGLNDYELTDEDKEILATKLTDGGALQSSTSVNGCLKEARMFRVGDLFEKKTMKGYPKLKENLEPNETGYHVYGQNIMWQHPQKVVMDKMYLHKVNPNHPILAYTSSVGEIGMIDESFYRSGDNGAFQGLLPKWGNNRYEIQYILSVLKRHFAAFGYSTSMANIVDLAFILPIQTDSQNNPIIDSTHMYHPHGYIPDWEYMEKYIKVTEKVVIRDVVEWKNEMIKKTKEVVGGTYVKK